MTQGRSMTMKAVFDKIPEDHRKYIAVKLKRAMLISESFPPLTEIPTLDEAFNRLGRAIIRMDLLKEVQERANDSMGYSFILVKIEGVHDLIECCKKEVNLLNQMIHGLLQKEVPYVVGDSSKSVDIPIGQQSR